MPPESLGQTLLIGGVALLVATLGLPILIVLVSRAWEMLDMWCAAHKRTAAEEAQAVAARGVQPARPVPPAPPAVIVRSTRHSARPADAPPAPAIRRHPPVVVTPVLNLPLWQEKGWRQARPGVLVGEFQAAGRRWRGQIEMPYRGAYRAFIWQPPLRELDLHPHRACFQRNGHGPDCYHVHYGSMPGSLDHAITTVEQVLAEAVTRYGGRA